MSPTRAPAVLIGVGNEWRRDDGVGWAVARAAAGELEQDADLVLSDGEPARLLDAWDGAEMAVVVDAVRTGSAPGTIHVLEWDDLVRAPGAHRSPAASHALGPGAAALLGEAIQRLPRRLVVVGVEGADFGEGPGLTPAVAGAVGPAVAESCRLVREALGANRS